MTHAEIQLIRSLDDVQARRETGLFVAEGRKLVRDFCHSKLKVRRIYYTGDEHFSMPDVFRREFAGAEAERVTANEMERASQLKTPTSCLALVEIPRRPFDPPALDGRLVLALDKLQNPGNLGTIIRLADWFGVTDILCSADTADCYNPKVVQATMGSLGRVAVHYGNLAEMLSALSGYVYGTFLEGENIYEAELPKTGVIVLGSEGRGISAEVERCVSHKLLIPPYVPASKMRPESLNVATAAAIVLSEFRRPSPRGIFRDIV